MEIKEKIKYLSLAKDVRMFLKPPLTSVGHKHMLEVWHAQSFEEKIHRQV